MSATTTITLITTTSEGSPVGNYDGSSGSFSSDKVKGDGYYGFADGVHTVQTRVTNFVGTIKVQATLVTTPTNTDWSDVSTIITGDGSTAVTSGYMTNFTGNYVWVRISVSDFTAGTINVVQMAH